MTQYIKKLPQVFQTVTEKKFFNATIDQVFSKKDSEYLSGYLGRREPGSYDPINDFYLPEPSKNKTWWQLEPTSYCRNPDNTRSNIFFYEDILDNIDYYGGNTLNQDRLFQSEYYSFGPPIDYDMFINYQNYYWVEQGLPAISITGVLGSDIIGKSAFTTPGTATPPNFTLSTGMRINLLSDPTYASPVIVENIGDDIGIRLVPQFPDYTAGTIFEFLPWDGSVELSTTRVIQNSYWNGNTWDVQTQPGTGDYITIERGSLDQNAWSRTNKWIHIDAINATIQATGVGFPVNATRALRPIIQFVADIELYKSGTQFRTDLNYGFRDDSAGNPLLLSMFQGKNLATLNSTYSIELTTNDLVCFFNDTTSFVVDTNPWDTVAWDEQNYDVGNITVVNQHIYSVTILSDNTVQFTPYISYATPIIEGDIVFIVDDAPYDGATRGQTWYYSQGLWNEAFNDKIKVNQPPLFQLFDHNGVKLDDTTTYPLSTFSGSKIFSYTINTEQGAVSDVVLGFPILYTSLGQSSDIVFENNLMTDRYTYSSSLTPITGYYYYKTIISDILYNSWNLYNLGNDIIPDPYIEVSKQRVIDKFVVGYGSKYQFPLSTTPYGYPSNSDIIVSVNGIEVSSSNIQVGGYSLIVINSIIYVDLTSYLGILLTSIQSLAPVVEIQTYTHSTLDPESKGYYQIPQQLEANPSQDEVFQISGSELIQHFSSIISNQLNFTGSAFGGSNNYRDSQKNRSVGSYILQNLAPALKSMLISSTDLDFISSVRFSGSEYTKFKNKYLSVAYQLMNQQFDPVAYNNNTVLITYWVDQILKTINISKEFSFVSFIEIPFS